MPHQESRAYSDEELTWTNKAIQYLNEIDDHLSRLINSQEHKEVNDLLDNHLDNGKDLTLLVPILTGIITRLNDDFYLDKWSHLKETMPEYVKKYSNNIETIVAKIKSPSVNTLFLADTYLRENNQTDTAIAKKLANAIRTSSINILYPKTLKAFKRLASNAGKHHHIDTKYPGSSQEIIEQCIVKMPDIDTISPSIANLPQEKCFKEMTDSYLKFTNNFLRLVKYFDYNSQLLSNFISQLAKKTYANIFKNNPHYVQGLVEIMTHLALTLDDLDQFTPAQLLILLKVNSSIDKTIDGIILHFQEQQISYESIPLIDVERKFYKEKVLKSIKATFNANGIINKKCRQKFNETLKSHEQSFCHTVFKKTSERNKPARIAMALLSNTITHLTLIGLLVNLHNYVKTGSWFLFNRRSSEVKFREISPIIENETQHPEINPSCFFVN